MGGSRGRARRSKRLMRAGRPKQPEHVVSREFIERERSNFLKTYRLKVLDSAELAAAAGDSDAGYITDVLDENLFRPVEEGLGVGEDARDVYRDAITWWDEDLTRVDAVLDQADQ